MNSAGLQVAIPIGPMKAAKEYIVSTILGQFFGIDFEILNEPSSEGWVITALGRGRIVMPDIFFGTQESWSANWHSPSRAVSFQYGEQSLIIPFWDRGQTVDSTSGLPDVFGICFFFLSRIEEFLTCDRDSWGRFLARHSWAGKYADVEVPVVDELVTALGKVISNQFGISVNESSKYRFDLSHDVDIPFAWSGQTALQTMRVASAALLKHRSLSRLKNIWLAIRDSRFDPNNHFAWMMNVAEKYSLSTCYYFIAGRNHRFDGTYRIESDAIKRLVQEILARGHSVGLHPSFLSLDRPQIISNEKSRFEGVVAAKVQSVRMHFLRFDVHRLARTLMDQGFKDDSSLGYAEAVGFRAGTGRSFYVFDLVENKTLSLLEKPLVFMEHSALAYMGLSHEDAFDRFSKIVSLVRRSGGVFSLLWHNHNLLTPDLRYLFESCVKEGVKGSLN